ncbi:glycosyl transferase family 1 [Cellvibrio zantedeschiae]|uniref:Glycosyl transferase family 1 n=1 Tax=Cellvibrio zantedeschiae TaxID=1237077 RepID=A0ABQ3B5J4_9GAMM|nr:glycosyltransferase family 4 protein [Cellvibrio zantedeschiae]GGY74384.1 glycosyl transferase family 1 [Cellvibrio zantedeschiae]
MSIKVTHIVRQYLPSIGGMEEVVRNIAMHQLRHSNQQTRIITLNRLFRNANTELPEREIIDGIEVIRLPFYGSSRYPICPTVLRELGDTDVIHVHGVDFFYDFLAATKWLHKRPLVLSTHGGFFHTQFASRAKQTYFKTITRLSSFAYDSVVATSANDGELFSQIMRKPKLQVIENGVDTEKYADDAALELQPTLIYFGRWSSNKGLLEALDLFAQLRERDDRWHLIIAGREYDHSLAELRAQVEALRLNGHVTLAANPSDEEIKDLIQQASYFLCLSHHEGFGIAPIEGMSAGLTPVLSDIPPFKRLVGNSGLGFNISNETSASDVIDQLLQLHEQGESAYAKRRSAAMAFAKHYAWSKVADRYLEIYEDLAGSDKGQLQGEFQP